MFPNGAEFCLSLRPAVEMCTNFPYWTSQWNHLKGTHWMQTASSTC